MVSRVNRISGVVGTACLMALSGWACAQGAASYPNKPVRVVIPFGAGGAVTTVMTALGERVGRELGQNFIADYRPGGDTVIGAAYAAKAAPDGYTLLEATSSYQVSAMLTANPSFDAIRDFTPVSMLARSPNVLTVHPSAPKTLRDFLNSARANPAGVPLAYAGPIALLNFQMLMNSANIKITPVSYKSSGDAVLDQVAGRVMGSFAGPASVTSLIKAGKLNGLAITGDKRSALLPDVPTFAEAGLKDFNPVNWFVMLAPAKTPRDIVEKLHAQFAKAQQSPEAIALLATISVEPFPAGLDEADRFLRSEAAQFARLIKESGIQPAN